jgi:D-glycero-D-manno-heptose 1,7-bisphosphate phosphatase
VNTNSRVTVKPTRGERPATQNQRRAVVLDRDGVINDYRRHVNTPDDLHLYEVAAPAIRLLNDAGLLVVVATNQGGVGLSYLTEAALAAIHQSLLERLQREGARIDDIVVCPHAPHAGCDCRKPRPGLLVELQRRHGFCFTDSFMVGDRETDVMCGRAVGMRTVRIAPDRVRTNADHVAPDLWAAAHWILTQTNAYPPS